MYLSEHFRRSRRAFYASQKSHISLHELHAYILKFEARAKPAIQMYVVVVTSVLIVFLFAYRNLISCQHLLGQCFKKIARYLTQSLFFKLGSIRTHNYCV